VALNLKTEMSSSDGSDQESGLTAAEVEQQKQVVGNNNKIVDSCLRSLVNMLDSRSELL